MLPGASQRLTTRQGTGSGQNPCGMCTGAVEGLAAAWESESTLQSCMAWNDLGLRLREPESALVTNGVVTCLGSSLTRGLEQGCCS